MHTVYKVTLIILIMLSITIVALASSGGGWEATRSVGLSPNMTTTTANASQAGRGMVLLYEIWETEIVCDSLDSVYTMGIGTDSTALYLDAYVGDSIWVDMYVHGTLAVDSLKITVEHSAYYNSVLGDSGYAYGMKMFDTLYTASGVTPFFEVPAASAQGEPQRVFMDRFMLDKPCIRIKVYYKRVVGGALVSADLRFVLSARRNNEILGGSSGRLNQVTKFPSQ